MAESPTPHPLNRHPVLLRLILWPLIMAVLVWDVVREPQRIDDAEFRLAGNRTNLYVALVAQPAADGARSGAMFFRRLDPGGRWSIQAERPQDEFLLHVVAWQEDLVALYASGGMFFVGPSGYGYQSPPSLGWRPVTVAVEERMLMVAGLAADGKPVFHRLSRKDQWGTAEQIGATLDWTPATAHMARAAVFRGQFHVVWTEPVPSGPLGGNADGHLLRFVWREPSGQWKGPFAAEFRDAAQTAYVLARPEVSIAANDDDLGMICLVRPAASGGSPSVGGQTEAAYPASASAEPRLVLARFYTSDGQWHVEWEVAPPVGRPDATRSVGLVPFRNRLVAAEYDGRTIRAYDVAFDASRDNQQPPLPETSIVLPLVAAQGGWIQNLLMVAAMVLVTVLAIRGYRQRVMPRPGLADDEYRRRAAIAAAYQVEKFMYLPVLWRRGMAFLVDALVVVLAMGVIVFAIEAPRRPDLFLSGQPMDPQVLINSMNLVLLKGVLTAVTLVYFLGAELILGRTPGKLIFGLMIVDADDRRPAWWRIVDRNLLRPLEVMLVPVALLIILWTPRSQRLGDLLGGTRVVMAVRRTDRWVSPQGPRVM